MRGFKSLFLRQIEVPPEGVAFLFDIVDLNPSGSEWSAGGTSEPRGGLRRSAGQIPLSPPKQNANASALAFRFGSLLFSLLSIRFSLCKREERKAIDFINILKYNIHTNGLIN